MKNLADRGNLIIRFSDESIRERLQRNRRRIYIGTAAPLVLLFTVYAFLYVGTGDNPAGRDLLLFHVFWVALFLLPAALVLAYLVPTHYSHYFNGFALYEKGISPPFRNLTSMPYPPLVTGWSVGRFIRAFVARVRRKELFIPFSEVKRFKRVREWGDSFVFDIITRDKTRVRIMAADLEEFYFSGDQKKLLAVYEMLEQVRRQSDTGASAISIDDELIGKLVDVEPGFRHLT